MATDDSTRENTLWGLEEAKKRCTKCGETKPLSEFRTFKPRSRGNGLRPTRRPKRRRESHCKDCVENRKRAWRKDNPERNKDQSRRSHIRKQGVSPEEYDRMLRQQGGVCAICRRADNGKEKGARPRSLAIDHDHDTGVIRGLLCTRCNTMIGNAGDDVSVLEAAIAYLKRNQREG